MELVGYAYIGAWVLALIGCLTIRKQRLLSGLCLVIFAVLSAGLLVTFLNQFTE